MGAELCLRIAWHLASCHLLLIVLSLCPPVPHQHIPVQNLLDLFIPSQSSSPYPRTSL